jgi:hypothetical protein
MKLIPMTDFVIQEWEKDIYTDDFARIVNNYARFLKQQLKLEMFVPVDEDGDVLNYEEIKQSVIEGTENWNIWENAKEKVLFEGFKSTARFKVSSGFEDMSFLCYNNGNTQVLVTDFTQEEPKTETCCTIEDLIKFKLLLTESAIKQLGL